MTLILTLIMTPQVKVAAVNSRVYEEIAEVPTHSIKQHTYSTQHT